MLRVNDKIRAHRVFLIDATGSNRGEVLRAFAQELAYQSDLDLVEVQPGTVPVCKIVDYGKMLYDQQKKQKHTHTPAPKEVRVGYKTDGADLIRQIEKAKTFLADGHRVTFMMTLKGRERHIQGGAAKNKLTTIVKELNSSFRPSDIQESGRGYTVVLHPHNG